MGRKEKERKKRAKPGGKLETRTAVHRLGRWSRLDGKDKMRSVAGLAGGTRIAAHAEWAVT